MSLIDFSKLISSFRFFGAKQRLTGGVSRLLLEFLETSAASGAEGVGVESGSGEFNNNDFLFFVSFICCCSQIEIGLFFQKNCHRRHVQTLKTILRLMNCCGSLSGRENFWSAFSYNQKIKQFVLKLKN